MKKTKKFKVAIIGNGKLAEALTAGLLLSGISASEIVVIMRTDTTSSPIWFERRGIAVTTDMQTISHAESIFITVVPEAAGPVLKRLHKVRFAKGSQHEIISFVSGLRIDQIQENMLDTADLRIMRATCNTNVACRTGIICCTGESEILEFLGQVIIENHEHILHSIETVGTTNAYDYQVLSLQYDSCIASPTLYTWLLGLKEMLSTFDFKAPVKMDSKYETIHRYLVIKCDIFRDALPFQYGIKARERALITMKSCVDTLLTIGPNVTVGSIDTLIKTVVTKGGCTERGINKITSLYDVNPANFKEIFLQVWNRIRQFNNDVRESIKNAA